MHTGVMVPEKPAYFSRFALKFAEILGAGIATAVSGYLVAHLGGFLSWPSQPSTPTAAIEVPANATAKTTERHRNRATASVPAETDTRAASARDEHSKEAARPAAKPAEVSAPAATTATGALDNDEKRSRAASASRKPIADAHAAKPAPKEIADLKPAPKETAEAKAHEEAAVEDQVRAALANVDASRTPTPPAMTPAPQTAAIPQPQPIPAPSNPAGPASTATSAPTPLAVPAAGPPAPPLDIQNAASTPPTAPVAVSASAQQTPPEPGSAEHGRDKIPAGCRRR